MRRLCALLACMLVGAALSAEKFRISDVSYEIVGSTKESALENAVEISTTRIFNSYEELHQYVRDIEQQLKNQRLFDMSLVNLTYDFNSSDGITLIHLRILTSDSRHFMCVPYPKYNSNDGLTLKLKMKDTNFLGTMNELNFDVTFAMEQDSEYSKKDYVMGLGFDFDYPFRLGQVKSSWNNSVSVDYTIGNTKPEFDISTGFSFEFPFDYVSLCLTLTQSIVQDFDYREYDDDLYFTEAAMLSIPIALARIDSWGDISWTPYVQFTMNWDKNGINKENDDLSSPIIGVGHSVATSRINWMGNFRQGLSVTLGQSISYNFQRDHYIPKVWGEIIGHKAFTYAGISTRFYGFATSNTTESIGSKLRGIRDEQKYKNSPQKALKVPMAFVINMDVPIHVVTTDWTGWIGAIFGEDSKVAHAFRFMRHLDFEMQVAPFVDIAFTKNTATGHIFSIKEGFYAGGLEVILYPLKWRSITVRASAGIDAGRKIIKKVVPSLIDTSWRSNVSAYELYVGIGLHY